VPRVCTVCTHPQRSQIDRELAGGAPHHELVALYRVSKDAVSRHSATHLPAQVVKAQAAEDVKQALDVLQQLKAINGATLQILQQARAVGDGDLALRAIDRIQRQIELQARLLGELDDRPQLNLVVSPEWQGLRQAVLVALVPYPEARLSVVDALEAWEPMA
jgi:hypothetical protein